MADQAVVIGIETYPGMNDLEGPCNDAVAFKNWLLRLDGGGLDPGNVDILLTRDFSPPIGVADAHPVLAELEELFRPLVIKAAQHKHTEGRLFIFVAGHGFADSQDMKSAALFTANAEILFLPHLAVIQYANYFRRHWAFDQVILIMDACRRTNELQQICEPPLPRVRAHPNAHKVKMFVGFGAGFNQVARERAFAGGKVHGIFTMALLDALEKANPNAIGRVNGSAVERYIHNNIDSFAGGASIKPPDFDVNQQKDVLFVKRGPFLVDVVFDIDAVHVNQVLIIAFGGVNEVYREAVAASPVTVRLSPGLYKARIAGTPAATNFEVPTDGNVTL